MLTAFQILSLHSGHSHRYFAPELLRSVCLCVSMSIVCLSAHAYLKKTTCPNFTKFSVHVTVARFSSGDDAIRYVLPVLWIVSCFHIMKPLGQNQGQRYVSSSLPGGGTGGEVAVYDSRLVKLVIKYMLMIPTHPKRNTCIRPSLVSRYHHATR